MSTLDGRRVRGDRTRRTVASRAAEIASLEGLASISFGRLAADLGISKSGIASAFPTKEELQLAAVQSAIETFIEHVVVPAQDVAAGLPRLRALVDAWLRYAETPVFPGRCFIVATAPEVDSRPGPVRDAIADAKRAWLALLEREISKAQEAGLAGALPPPLVAFEIDALLTAANTACNFRGNTEPLRHARTILESRILGRHPIDD